MDALKASRLIFDEYAAKILIYSFKKPSTAIEMSRKLDIPIAACYRRIHQLERYGLISCIQRALTQKGKRISVYQSQLVNAFIFFEKGKVRVRFDLANGSTQDFGGTWQPIEVVSE